MMIMVMGKTDHAGEGRSRRSPLLFTGREDEIAVRCVKGNAEMDMVREAVAEFYPIAQNMAQGDDDLQQELALSILESLDRGFESRGLIIHQMKFQRDRYRSCLGGRQGTSCGRSIDNGDLRFRRGVQRVSIEDLVLRSRDNPETTALFNISFERFKRDLSEDESTWFEARSKGQAHWTRSGYAGVSGWKTVRVRTMVREKFRKWFEE